MTAHLDCFSGLGSFIFFGCKNELNLEPEFEPECAWYGSRNIRPIGPPEHGGVCFPDKKEFQGSLGILGLSEASAVPAGEASR